MTSAPVNSYFYRFLLGKEKRIFYQRNCRKWTNETGENRKKMCCLPRPKKNTKLKKQEKNLLKRIYIFTCEDILFRYGENLIYLYNKSFNLSRFKLER